MIRKALKVVATGLLGTGAGLVICGFWLLDKAEADQGWWDGTLPHGGWDGL